MLCDLTDTGADRGCTRCTCTPPQDGEKIIWGPNFQGKVVSAPLGRECTPRGRAKVHFKEIGEIWAVGEVIQVVLAFVLRATTKKRRQLFWEKKCTPDKNLATPMLTDVQKLTEADLL